ncbi:MAG: 4-hydroxy-tetrahydrodipicolinate synthase [Proteobacteria bacterium]|nr:4-hydroxy-tetrahydrodipicolinate synthase [Pseudomonadota bacterium]
MPQLHLGTKPLTGSLVAVVTPMGAGGSLDPAGLDALLDWHVAEGTSGIVIVGTTGESPTVTIDEHHALIAQAVRHVGGRIPVIAGVGANATAEAIALTRHAHAVGADAGLSVAPYYNKPMQEGLYRHFRAIAESSPLPIIVYNVPGRTVSDVSTDTLLRLAEIPNIVGVKDATGDLVRHVDLIRRLPTDKPFALFSGNDDTALPYMLLGGHGVISVTANVAPRAMAAMCAAALAGDVATARAQNQRLMPLHTKLFVEANPIAVKWALAEMGKIRNELRLPMTPLAAANQDVVRSALREAGALA